MARYRLLLGFAVLSVALLGGSIETQAKIRSVTRNNPLKVEHSSVNGASLLRTRKSRTLKEKSKALRVGASKACACACPLVQDLAGGFGSCFSDCLYSAGVTREKAAACLTICVAAGTGNPVGIAVCAACLGIGEWIAGYCGLKCAWNSTFSPDDGPVSRRRSQPRSKRVPDFVRV